MVAGPGRQHGGVRGEPHGYVPARQPPGRGALAVEPAGHHAAEERRLPDVRCRGPHLRRARAGGRVGEDRRRPRRRGGGCLISYLMSTEVQTAMAEEYYQIPAIEL